MASEADNTMRRDLRRQTVYVRKEGGPINQESRRLSAPLLLTKSVFDLHDIDMPYKHGCSNPACKHNADAAVSYYLAWVEITPCVCV